MKKILLATSILVGTASVAAADISMSGGARFGIAYNGATWALTNRFTINFDGSGETDGGLTFGGRVRLRAGSGAAAGLSGSNAYIEGSGFRVTVGNINGAIEMIPGLYNNGIGLTGNGWHGVATNILPFPWGWDSFSSGGAGVMGIAADYSMGDFAVHASYGSTSGNRAISASYTFGDWTVGAGVQADAIAAVSPGDIAVVVVSGSFGDFGVNLSHARIGNGILTKTVLGGSYSMGATSVNAYYASANTGVTSYGIGAAYDLGGGASIRGGFVSNSFTGNTADLGVRLSF